MLPPERFAPELTLPTFRLRPSKSGIRRCCCREELKSKVRLKHCAALLSMYRFGRLESKSFVDFHFLDR